MDEFEKLKCIPHRYGLDAPHITGKLFNDHRRDCDPKAFVEKYIKDKGCRNDLREFNEYRECSAAFDANNLTSDFACVRIGQTHVICGVTSSVVKPPLNNPEKGIIEFDFRFLGHSGNELPETEKKTVVDLARESVKKILFHSKWIDLEQLCLIPKKYVHKILVEVLIFTFDGAIVDSSLLSIVLALSRFLLPKYEIDDELGIITKIDNQTVPLIVGNNIPTSSTFVLVSNQILFDPNWYEELACDSILRISLDPDSNDSDCIFLLEMIGKDVFNQEQIKACFEEAKMRGKYFKRLLEKC